MTVSELNALLPFPINFSQYSVDISEIDPTHENTGG